MKKNHTYIIAEISANHNGSKEAALELVRLAAEAGADAVKIQTYTADSMTMDSDLEYFKVGGGTLWDGRTLYDLYQEASTPYEWHADIFNEAAKCNIDCFSTPFDADAVDFLEQFNPPFYKVASFELTDHPLLEKIASTKRPVIMSTGMGTLEEIEESVAVLKNAGCPELVLLKCTSSYPAPAEEANLARISDMAERFGVITGLSDHTMGLAVPVVAVSLGAKVIEKHFCKSRDEPGPDSAFSLEPDELKDMVTAVRVAEKAIGEISYERTAAEEKSIVFRRSLFFTKDLPAGHVISADDVKVIRPAHGIAPKYLNEVIGSKTARLVKHANPVTWDDVVKS